MNYINDDMYFIIELSDGTLMPIGVYQYEYLPTNTIAFTIVHSNGTNMIPKCYSVKMGTKFIDKETGIEKAYFNGDIIIVKDNTTFARDYEALNRAFIESRVMHDVTTR